MGTKEIMISLVSLNDVKEFVNLTMTVDCDLDLISGRYSIDAKSIMGILSLDLSKPIKLIAYASDTTELEQKIKKFLI